MSGLAHIEKMYQDAHILACYKFDCMFEHLDIAGRNLLTYYSSRCSDVQMLSTAIRELENEIEKMKNKRDDASRALYLTTEVQEVYPRSLCRNIGGEDYELDFFYEDLQVHAYEYIVHDMKHTIDLATFTLDHLVNELRNVKNDFTHL